MRAPVSLPRFRHFLGRALLAASGLSGAMVYAQSEADAMALMSDGVRESADIVIHNAQILTMNPEQPRATALAVRAGYLSAVGNDADVQAHIGPETQVLDANGYVVIPGLIDAHLHGIRGGQTYLFETYWHDALSLQSGLLDLQRAAQARSPDQWVAVVGSWIPEQFAEKRGPTVADLDRFVPDHPAYVQSLYDYALVNHRGIEVLALDTPHPLVPTGITVERDAQGKATGKLLGGIGPFNALFAHISQGLNQEANLRAFFKDLNARGVTGFIDPSAGGPAAFEPLFSLHQQGALSVRVGYRLSPPPGGNETAWVQAHMAFRPSVHDDGYLAFLGLGESLIMGMNDGVRMAPGFASSSTDQKEMRKALAYAAKRRIPVELHAYTDDSAASILDAIEEVAREHPIKDLRWSLAHLNTGSLATLRRMRDLGLAFSVQMGPYFEAPAILAANGPRVAAQTPPSKAAVAMGMRVAGGTDATRIGVAGVWQAIEYQVSGRSLGGIVQRRADLLLTPEQALMLYTRDAAWLAFADETRGSLIVGKLADLAVLDRDPLRIPVDQLHQTQSLLTLLGGRVVHGEDWLKGQSPNPQAALTAR
ncbi:amidohydrolase [Alcaligenes faecalis]|uniref:amidohydrolase n=1 Tax=Alcaligenes faecalis TaxID=511 RepID=UPI0021C1DFF4|nr:amidohydrolase [Alcaligenes faecalis]